MSFIRTDSIDQNTFNNEIRRAIAMDHSLDDVYPVPLWCSRPDDFPQMHLLRKIFRYIWKNHQVFNPIINSNDNVYNEHRITGKLARCFILGLENICQNNDEFRNLIFESDRDLTADVVLNNIELYRGLISIVPDDDFIQLDRTLISKYFEYAYINIDYLLYETPMSAFFIYSILLRADMIPDEIPDEIVFV